jgi:hypothetical protein
VTARRLAGLLALAAFLALPSLAQLPVGNAPGQPAATDAAIAADESAAGVETPADDTASDASAAADDPAGAAPAAEEVDPTEVPVEQPKAAGSQLPAGFTPPAEQLPLMTLRKPTMTQEEITKEQNDLRKLGGTGIDRIITSGDLTQQNRQALARYARLQIAQMAALDFSNPDERRKISDIGKRTLLELRNAATTQANENRVRDFREALLSEMVKACSEVLPDNNFHVRMQAATILAAMNIREEPLAGGRRQPPVSFVPAMTPLLDALANAEQPQPVKVVAAVGVGRIAEYAESIPVETRYRAGAVLAQELARKDTHPWYQMRLAEALAAIELELDKNRQPIVLNALLDAVGDNTRHCLGRTAAAKALGRIPTPNPGWNDKVVATALVQLAGDMSRKYNARPNRVEWFSCYENLYLALAPGLGPTGQPEDLTRLPSSAVLRKGSLTAPLQSAHDLIRPIVQHVLKQPADPKQPHAPIPTELLKPLDDFLKANQAPPQ